MSELDQDFKRLEGIIIKLIDQQKLVQMEQKKLNGIFNIFLLTKIVVKSQSTRIKTGKYLKNKLSKKAAINGEIEKKIINTLIVIQFLNYLFI